MKLFSIFKKKRTRKKQDIIVLLLLPIFATVVSFITQTNLMGSNILFFLLPSLYLSIRAPRFILKSLKFSSLTLIFTFPLNYAAHISKQWVVEKSIFPIEIGYTSLETVIWIVLYVYLVVMFYQHFLDKHVATRKTSETRKRNLFALYLFMAFMGVLLSILYPFVTDLGYYYLLGGVLFVLIPVFFVELRFPQFITKFFKAGAYFFILTLLYELTALRLGWWHFPVDGKFIGWVTIFGLQFPLEEFIFWIMLGAMSFLSYFEYYDDLK